MMVAVMPDSGKRRSSNDQEEQRGSNFLHARNLARIVTGAECPRRPIRKRRISPVESIALRLGRAIDHPMHGGKTIESVH